ncbi:lanthionine synthetase LanC family protein [Pyxidicoccus sp. 3LFB2]
MSGFAAAQEARTKGMRRTVSWSPLLEGAEREAALRAVGNILEDLPRFPTQGPLATSLARGQTGVAVLFAYHASVWANSPYGAKADALLDEATEALATTALLPDLYDGFPGIAWAVQHLQGTPESPDEDPLTDIDAALADYLQARPWLHRYDLVSGLVGLGVYTLERLPRPGARQCLEHVVARLGELAEPAGRGVRWMTPPHHIEAEARERYPRAATTWASRMASPACWPCWPAPWRGASRSPPRGPCSKAAGPG